MHETAIASSILRIVLESAADYQDRGAPLRVTGVNLKTGLLSCLEPQTLKGCFEIMAEGTAAEGACLNIEVQALSGHCASCGPVKTERRGFECPLCGKSGVDWQGGHELQVSSIMVEQGNEKREDITA